MFREITVLKVSENSKKNIFSSVHFRQFGLSNLPPITTLKTDSMANVSFESFENFQNYWKGVCGGITF